MPPTKKYLQQSGAFLAVYCAQQSLYISAQLFEHCTFPRNCSNIVHVRAIVRTLYISAQLFKHCTFPRNCSNILPFIFAFFWKIARMPSHCRIVPDNITTLNKKFVIYVWLIINFKKFVFRYMHFDNSHVSQFLKTLLIVIKNAG